MVYGMPVEGARRTGCSCVGHNSAWKLGEQDQWTGIENLFRVGLGVVATDISSFFIPRVPTHSNLCSKTSP